MVFSGWTLWRWSRGAETGWEERGKFGLQLVPYVENGHCRLVSSSLGQARLHKWLGVSFLELRIGGRNNTSLE